MKLLFDLFPVILFFTAFKLAEGHPAEAASLAAGFGYAADAKQLPVLLATAVAIFATIGQVAWQKVRHRKVDTMLWVSFAIIFVFGGATLWLHDETFIKWKPTVLYWMFAAVLVGSAVFLRKNLIRALMAQNIELPDAIWSRLNQAWAAFFAFMGAANLYVAFNFPTDIWVNFKMFGTLGLMLVFVLAQGVFLSKHLETDEDPR